MIISDGGFTDKIRITNMRRRGGQMLEDHLNPRELEGSMEVKKSEEEVFKPAGNRHHYRQHCHKDYCIHIKGTRNFPVTLQNFLSNTT